MLKKRLTSLRNPKQKLNSSSTGFAKAAAVKCDRRYERPALDSNFQSSSSTIDYTTMIIKRDKVRKHRHVRFAEAPQVISLHGRQTTFSPTQKDLLWYSQEDFDQFRLDTTLYSDAIKVMFQDQKLLFGHHGDFGNILGLEKYLLTNSYHDRRTRLKTAVFEEQARQRLRQEEMKTGLIMDGILCGSFANYRLLSAMRLAKIADKESRWARERAQIIGLALQSHLSMTESITAGE